MKHYLQNMLFVNVYRDSLTVSCSLLGCSLARAICQVSQIFYFTPRRLPLLLIGGISLCKS